VITRTDDQEQRVNLERYHQIIIIIIIIISISNQEQLLLRTTHSQNIITTTTISKTTSNQPHKFSIIIQSQKSYDDETSLSIVAPYSDLFLRILLLGIHRIIQYFP
jgi:GH15 family glucan-1,4-alpha-glucosidase